MPKPASARHLNPRVAVTARTAIAASGMIAAVLVGISHLADVSDWLKAPDAWTYDWRTAHFGPQPELVRSDIAVVTIDEASLERYPAISPIDRGLQARLVSALENAGAKAIGLDFLYDRATEPEKDDALRHAIASARIPVVIGAVDARTVLRDRDPDIALAWQERFISDTGKTAGHLYFFTAEDSGRLIIGDQVIRHRIGPSPLPPHRLAFAEALAEATGLRKGQPTTQARLIDWQRRPAKGIDLYPVPVLLVGAHDPGAPASAMLGSGWEALVKGRVIFVGGSFGDRDRHLTPLSVSDGVKVPGVLIHAQILAQLVDGREVRTLPVWIEVVLLLATALIGWRLASYTWTLPVFGGIAYQANAGGFAETVAAAIAVFVIGVAVYATTGFIFPSAAMAIAFMGGLLLGNPPLWLAWALRREGRR